MYISLALVYVAGFKCLIVSIESSGERYRGEGAFRAVNSIE